LLAPGLDLVFALETRHQPGCRIAERTTNIRVARLGDAALEDDHVPDCHRRDVSPKQAATSRERRNRVGSSIAVMKLSAVTGPTPAIAIKRRHSSLWATIRKKLGKSTTCQLPGYVDANISVQTGK